MEAIKKILLATDLSEDCRNAYNYAFDLASALNGQIALLHVIVPKPLSSPLEMRINKLLGKGSFESIMQDYENDARSVLIGKRKEVDIIKDALAKFRASLAKFSDSVGDKGAGTDNPPPDDEILVNTGDVVEEILSVAEEQKSDLIILSTHARSSEEAAVSKTVQDVLRQARVPVTLVPPVRI
ncbi:universal stress protein [Desulfosarcina ovata]|uniref:UspA domain-containing protein n=1 Tax=Desulfosarcina ovata subsp. ovata TaxID=2752305 RepID=A0A5K8ALN8_9BACT|nr:universal stress protein [Desulfosarcina ovata]BBO93436.1 hypothetical protein DSCOOX_66160 [Desulfosarcina ovata subsp. ovata]